MGGAFEKILRIPFGTISDGREAGLYLLKNSRGTEAAVTDYGAALVRMMVCDKKGQMRDVVLGYDCASDYEEAQESMGATVGRFANRIGKGSFTLKGINYQLTRNNGPNTLHGGRDFYVHRLWKVMEEKESLVTFALKSPDGDQGFPGNLDITVTYELTEDNELMIRYTARADQDTPLNLTNHSYFNLAGHDSGSVLSHVLVVQADQITEPDENNLPTGNYLPVEGTALDFRQPKALGRDIGADCPALITGNGYDQNYVLRNDGKDAGSADQCGERYYREAAALSCQESGITMTVSTDLPGMQIYTANYLSSDHGKGGSRYQPRDAVCLETQYYPDSVNKEHFPGGILKAGETFESRTGYRFSTDQ